MTNNFETLYQLLFKSSVNPSEHMASPWLYARSDVLNLPESLEKVGKWCIFRDGGEIDASWKKIKDLCKKNKIAMAKVASATSGARFKGVHVICVYTLDYSDTADVIKIRELLRKNGFTENIGYKRDIETINGVYGEKEWYYHDEAKKGMELLVNAATNKVFKTKKK
jgi:Domain of unknown function (DUF1917)